MITSRFFICLNLLLSLGFISPAGTHRAWADSELGQQLKVIISSDTDLDAKKKAKLSAIIDDVSKQNDQLQLQIREKKIALLKALLSKPEGSKEARTLKKNLIKLHDQRLENSLRALENLKEVLGHQKDPEILFQKIMDLGGRY